MADQRTGRVDASWKLHDRAVEVIPLGTQTHSKAPREALRGIEPCFLARGKGGRIWDVDGNEYVDFRSGASSSTASVTRVSRTRPRTSTRRSERWKPD